MDLWRDGELLLRRNLVTNGWTDDEVARGHRAGALSRIRRGTYVAGPPPRDATLRHRRLVEGTLATLRRDAVISHQSAAVLHGFPLWGVRLDRVHVTRQPPASTDRSRVLHCHVARLRDDDVVALDGVPVTAPLRTALDLARTLPFEPGVVVLDAALHAGLLDAVQLGDRTAEIAGLPGSRSAARAIRFADGRSESVGESRSRILLHQLGLAPSTLQLPVHDADGVELGRADFAWEEQHLLGEFDGRVKYGRLLRPGEEPGDAVFREKRREDAMRGEGQGVVRWTWSEIDARVLGPRVGRALERARARARRR